MNRPTAIAKLTATIPSPLDALIGARNKPVVKRAPVVIMSTAAAERTSIHSASSSRRARSSEKSMRRGSVAQGGNPTGSGRSSFAERSLGKIRSQSFET
jgi:hypothetical protein